MDTNTLDSHVGNSGSGISPQIKEYLLETAKWGKFLSIAGFIILGLIVIGGIFFSTALANLGLGGDELGASSIMSSGVFAAVYIIIALIYFFPILYLYRFSTKIKPALLHNDEGILTEGFKNLKSMFKYMGIFTAILLGFYAISIVSTLIGMI